MFKSQRSSIEKRKKREEKKRRKKRKKIRREKKREKREKRERNTSIYCILKFSMVTNGSKNVLQNNINTPKGLKLGSQFFGPTLV